VARVLPDKKKLQNYLRGAAEEAEPAPPRCRHFGECGGCEFQDRSYAAQLDLKRRALAFVAETILSEIESAGGGTERQNAERLADALASVDPEMIPSPSPFGYRQRMDYVYAFGKAGLRRAQRRWQVTALRECPLLGDAGFAVFQAALELAGRRRIPGYDYMRHEGELRYFVVRRSRAGGIMLSLVTKTLDRRGDVLAILSELLDRGMIVSGHWLHAPGLGDVSFGARVEHVGEPLIYENMNDVRLGIGPNSFFQANPAVAEMAYAKMAEFARSGGEALDMYSGVGSIALTVSRNGVSALAVENQPENLAIAGENIRINSAANVELIAADAVEFLLERAERGGKAPGTIIVNPPRPGVTEKGMEAIRRIGQERLAYLSCNPFTLLRDMAKILDAYSLRSLALYDMFPQTRHFETLALFSRR
jgi:23S rRNA (uracil-5-)-methyltransferase RumA